MDLELIGKGNTASVYKYDANKIVKLFVKGYDEKSIVSESKKAILFTSLVKNSAKCYGLVEIDDQLGIVYDYINGQSLLDYYYATQDGVFLLNTLVNMHKEILQKKCEEAMSYKDFLMYHCEDEITRKKIEALPDESYLCHGDFHPGNIMIDKDRNYYVIDFNNVVKGPKEYDVARAYFLIKGGLEKPTELQELMANLYLEVMGYTMNDINKYLDVLRTCRRKEMSR